MNAKNVSLNLIFFLICFVMYGLNATYCIIWKGNLYLYNIEVLCNI